MRKNVLKQTLLALCLTMALPFVKAQVHVGDILCEGDVVVSPNSLDSTVHNAIGVVFHVDASGKHGWAVALQDVEGEQNWGPNAKDTPLRNISSKQQAINDVNGYANTKTVIDLGYFVEFPAFETLDFENGWYLPAIGQLKRLYKNMEAVNSAFAAVGGTPLSTEEEYWSSTERYICEAWYIDPSGEIHCKDHSFNGNKDDRRLVRGVRNF